MAATYEPIASVTLGADAVEVEITSIPSIYTDFILICTGRSKQAGSSANGLRLRINGDTGSNYSTTRLNGNGSSASSNRDSNYTYIDGADVAQDSGNAGIVRFQFMSYVDTNVYKTCLIDSTTPDAVVRRSVGLWRSTSAISSVKVYRDGSINLAAGFTASLYGIKAA